MHDSSLVSDQNSFMVSYGYVINFRMNHQNHNCKCLPLSNWILWLINCTWFHYAIADFISEARDLDVAQNVISLSRCTNSSSRERDFTAEIQLNRTSWPMFEAGGTTDGVCPIATLGEKSLSKNRDVAVARRGTYIAISRRRWAHDMHCDLLPGVHHGHCHGDLLRI